MNFSYETFVSVAWTQLWQVTLLGLAVLCIAKLFCRPRPHLAYLLWMLVFVKCVTPPMWSSPAGVFSWVQTEDPKRASEFETAVEPGTIVLADTSPLVESDDDHATGSPGPDRVATRRANEPAAASARGVAGPSRSGWSFDPIKALFYLWLAGAIAALGWVLIKRAACCWFIARSCYAASDTHTVLLNRVRLRLNIKRQVRLLICRRRLGPALLGWFFPTIILPEALAKDAGAETLEPVLAHELIHFRRGDGIAAVVQITAQALWWFHPLVWLANWEASRQRERCCDEEAVLALDFDPACYAQSLLDVARRKRGLQPVFASPGMRPLDVTKQRLEHIMKHTHHFQKRTPFWCWVLLLILGVVVLPGAGQIVGDEPARGPANGEQGKAPPVPVPTKPEPGEWPQFLGGSHRNNVAAGTIPSAFDINKVENIRWTASLGSNTYNSVVVSNGKVFIGTNNAAAYQQRSPSSTDLAVLLCFEEKTGKFLWQYSSEKLPGGRVFDWPLIGLCSAPVIRGDRCYVYTNRCEVVCLDVNGFTDRRNDGPYQTEEHDQLDDADIVWKYDMFNKQGVRPHNAASCSMTIVGELLLLGTSNGVDETHINVTAPSAPSFAAIDCNTGELVWKDNSISKNVLEGQWSSPAYGVFDGVPQVIFAGGDGWLVAFDWRDLQKGKSNLLWKFDCNDKRSKWILGSRGARNSILATPVIYDGLVYIPTGQDLEKGEGEAILWCVDPTKRGDVSTEIVYNKAAPDTPIAHKPRQACEEDKGDFTRKNPNSAMVWRFDGHDYNGDGKVDYQDKFNRTCGSVAISNQLLVVADSAGFVHCINAKNGKGHWVYDQLAASTGTPLIVDKKIVVVDEDGDVTLFKLSKKLTVLSENMVESSVYGTPVAVNNTLYISSNRKLYAIASKQKAVTGPAAKSTTKEHKLLWKYKGKGGNPAAAVFNNIVLAVVDDHLTGIDAKTGKLVWKLKTESTVTSPPTVHGKQAYIGDEKGRLYCLDPATGLIRWAHSLGGEVNGGVAMWKKLVLCGSQDGAVYALNSENGKLVWKTELGDQIRTTPAIDHGMAIISCCDGKLHLLDAETGKPLAKFELNSPTGASPTVQWPHVYVGTEAGCLFCFDLNTRKQLWKTAAPADGQSIRGAAVVQGDQVIYGAKDNTLRFLEKQNGRFAFEHKANGSIIAAPIVAQNLVYLAAENGEVRAITMTEGKTEWTFETGARCVATVAGEMVIVVTEDGEAYGFAVR